MIFQENKQTKKNVISEIVVLLKDCKENILIFYQASVLHFFFPLGFQSVLMAKAPFSSKSHLYDLSCRRKPFSRQTVSFLGSSIFSAII